MPFRTRTDKEKTRQTYGQKTSAFPKTLLEVNGAHTESNADQTLLCFLSISSVLLNASGVNVMATSVYL
jgi:hypothetical protein